ncbi:MAG: hypothetical protein CSA68_05875 [Rhodobacterales bacterium]|nr:MAG: hypothetical protein CSA68_05875 [Rhodobacterales bacterium]
MLFVSAISSNAITNRLITAIGQQTNGFTGFDAALHAGFAKIPVGILGFIPAGPPDHAPALPRPASALQEALEVIPKLRDNG